MASLFGIILSSNGFEGVQIFNATPDTQKRVLAVLLKLHPILKQLLDVMSNIMEDRQNHENSYCC